MSQQNKLKEEIFISVYGFGGFSPSWRKLWVHSSLHHGDQEGERERGKEEGKERRREGKKKGRGKKGENVNSCASYLSPFIPSSPQSMG
jgi:hypothetical protein